MGKTDKERKAPDDAKGLVHGDKNQTKKLKNKKTEKGSALAFAMALELEMEIAFEFNQGQTSNEEAFVAKMRQEIASKSNHNKTTVEKLAKSFGIDNQNQTKELTELAIVLEARQIAFDTQLTIRQRYESIVELYHSQVNLSHRTSLSILMQQYSTAAPISYLAGMWVKSIEPDALYFEPSAGNGLLCHALPCGQTHVNELDDIRLANLQRQPFKTITQRDASLPFGFGRIFDGVVTNPPFGDLEKVEIIDGFHLKKLEHLMAIWALESMKDKGRAAIIIGGHTRYDDVAGTISNKGDRYFLNYLYNHYHVADIIPIDGHNLYSRQGTAFDTRLILIEGRKSFPSGIAEFAPKEGTKNKHLREVVTTFDALFERVLNDGLEHFMKLAKVKESAPNRFNPHDKISFIGHGSSVCFGTVVKYSGESTVEVLYNRNTIVLPERNLVPALFACSTEKPEQGYKAFKNLKKETRKAWIAKFVDGESIRITNAYTNKEAKEMAVRERLRNQN
jgi:hypothetical protein